MKRKVVKHGPSTLTISLPSKWCKKNNIKVGDELDLTDVESQLIIRTSESKKKKRMVANLAGYGFMAERMMATYYREGYDVIEVKYRTSEELDYVLKSFNKIFIGFEIVEHKHKKIVFGKLANLEYREFHNIYRKMFQLLIDIADEGLVALKKNDTNALKSLTMLDSNINRFSDFCIRLIVQNKINIKANGTFHHLLADVLESVGDHYKDIFSYHLDNNSRLNENFETIFLSINNFVKLFYSVFYNYEEKRLIEFGNERKKIKEELQLIKSKVDEDFEVQFHLNAIVEELFGMYDALAIINRQAH